MTESQPAGTIQLAQAEGTSAPAQAASYTCVVVSQGNSVTIPVLAGGSGVVLSATQPPSGAVQINPDDTLTFTPDAAGPQTFRFSATDGAGNPVAGDVAVFVNAADGGNPPLATLGQQELAEVGRACATGSGLATTTLAGSEVSASLPAPGERLVIEAETGQAILLNDPGFTEATYLLVEEGLLAITPDGRVVYVEGLVDAAESDQPPTIRVAGDAGVSADDLVLALQPYQVPDVYGVEGEVPVPTYGAVHGGGAGFAAFDPGALPPGFDPFGPLGPTDLSGATPPTLEGSGVEDDLAGLQGGDDGFDNGDDGFDDGDDGFDDGDDGFDDGDDGNGGDGDGDGDGNGGGDGGDGDGDGDGDGGDGGDGDGGDGDGGGNGDNGDQDDGGLAIVFQNEVTDKVNALGIYRIGEDGEILDPRIVFPEIEHSQADDRVPDARPGGGPLDSGDRVLLSDVYDDSVLNPDSEFGLFLISDGFTLNPDLAQGQELVFQSPSGGPANLNEFAVPELFAVGSDGTLTPVNGDVLHMADASPQTPFSNRVNPPGGGDGGGRVLSDFLAGGEGLTVAFEDSPIGTGDNDYNDLVVTIEPIDRTEPPVLFGGLTPRLTGELSEVVTDPIDRDGISIQVPDGDGGTVALQELIDDGVRPFRIARSPELRTLDAEDLFAGVPDANPTGIPDPNGDEAALAAV